MLKWVGSEVRRLNPSTAVTRPGCLDPRFCPDRLVWTHLLLEPAHGLLFADAVLEADPALFPLLVSDAETGSAQNLNGEREPAQSGIGSDPAAGF